MLQTTELFTDRNCNLVEALNKNFTIQHNSGNVQKLFLVKFSVSIAKAPNVVEKSAFGV